MITTLGNDVVLVTGEKGSAVFSKDQKYRYRLMRPLDGGGALTVVWIMLNPSTADADTDDATIRRCASFSRALKASSFVVVNLFAYRATNPKELLSVRDPFGPRNDDFLRGAGLGAGKIVVAWGAMPNKLWAAAKPAIEILKTTYNGMLCLGRTKSGAPRHPVRLSGRTEFEPW